MAVHAAAAYLLYGPLLCFQRLPDPDVGVDERNQAQTAAHQGLTLQKGAKSIIELLVKLMAMPVAVPPKSSVVAYAWGWRICLTMHYFMLRDTMHYFMLRDTKHYACTSTVRKALYMTLF
jgi:hypothetical protein